MPQLIPTVAMAIMSAGATELMTPGQKRAARPVKAAATPAEAVGAALAQSIDPGGPQIGILGRRRIGGRVVLSAKSGADTYIVLNIAGSPVTAINAVYINNALVAIDGAGDVTTGTWVNGATKTINIKLYTGAQTVVDPVLDAAFGGWTSAFVGVNQTYARIKLTPSGTIFAQGTPDFTFDVSGFKVYDPRDGAQSPTNPATWLWSENAALVCAGYLMHDLGRGLTSDDIDWNSVTIAAAICDESVALSSGLTEARYACAAFWYTSDRHEDVLPQIENSMGGHCYLLAGKYHIDAASFDATNSPTITPDDYESDGFAFADYPALDGTANGVRGRFASPTNNYELRDFPSYQDAAAIAEDSGIETWLTVDFPMVTRSAQAQRLARIEYNRARKGARASVATKFKHFDTVRGDIVRVTDDLAGIDITFRVLEDFATGAGNFTCSFDLQTEDATFLDWLASYEIPMPPSVTLVSAGGVGVNPDDTGTLQPPGAEFYWTAAVSGSPTVMRAKMIASPSARATHYEFRVANSGGWTQIPIATAEATANVGYAGTASYTQHFQVRSVVLATGETSNASAIAPSITQAPAGAPNNAAATTPYFVMPVSLAPRIASTGTGAAVLNFYAAPTGGGARVSHVNLYENTTNNPATATLINRVANANGTKAVAGAVGSTKYYWTRAEHAASGAFGPHSNALLVAF